MSGPAEPMPSASAPAARWRVCDLVALIVMGSWVYAIVQIPPIPISPIVYTPFLLLLAADSAMWRAWRAVRAVPAFGWVAGMLGFRILLLPMVAPITYETVSEAGRTAAAVVALAGLAMYAASAPVRLRRLGAGLLVACGISLLWYLAELAGARSLVAWRVLLYADIYAVQDEGIVETIRSGLVPFLHLLGYQLAAFLPLLGAVILEPRERRWPLLAVTVAAAVGLVALTVSLQRSALMAAAVSFAAMAWYGRRTRRLVTVGLLAAVVCGAGAVAVIQRNETVAMLAQTTLLSKLRSREASYDSALRMRLQGRALELIAQYPLGLRAARKEWSEVGFRHVYRRMWAVSPDYDRPIAVHNGYLGEMLTFGLGYGIVLAVAVGVVFLTAFSLLRAAFREPPARRAWTIAIASCVLGLFSFQAITHNASIATFEPVSLVVLALLVAAAAARAPHRTEA